MAAADFPENLKFLLWEKKKDAVPKGHDVAERLKALQKKHDALAWKSFEAAAWAKPCKKLDELETAFAATDRTCRAAVLGLKKDANELAVAAQKMGKGAAKPTQDAAKAIGSAAGAYIDAIDTSLEDLKKAYEDARVALLEAGGGDEKPEPPAALLDPKRLVAVLNQCKREPALRVQFAFVDGKEGKEKQPPALAMHLRQTGRSMFATLQEAAGVKAGAFGVAWLEATTLFMQVDKAFSGLTKKARLPLQKCGFRVSKIVIVGADGKMLEQDEELAELAEQAEGARQAPAPAPGGTTAAAPAASTAAAPVDEAAFALRLKALLAKVAAAAATKAGADAKMLVSEAGTLARKKDFTAASELLGRAEALLGGKAGAAAPATKPATPPAAGPNAVALKQAQLVWSTTRDKLRSELARLEAAILGAYAGDGSLPQVTRSVRRLDRVLELFDASLVDKIDAIQAAASADERGRLQGEAREIVQRYRAHLASDPLVVELDANPFTPVVAQASLVKSLETIAARLG